MRQLRFCPSAILAFSTLLLPASLYAGQRGIGCDQLRADLASQAQALKQQHLDEMAQCEAASGRQSQACQDLGERQKEDARQLKESTLLRLRGCNYSSLESLPFHHILYYQNANYPYRHHHHHHYHHDHDGDGHHGHDSVRTDNRNLHSLGEHGFRATHHASAGSSLSAGVHGVNGGHVAGSLGHSGLGHSGTGTAWHGGSVYAAGASYAGGHVGSYSTGGGAAFSGGHGGSYGGSSGGGYSSGYSGGGSVSSSHSGGFSGGSSTSSSSSSSSSGSSSGGHVR